MAPGKVKLQDICSSEDKYSMPKNFFFQEVAPLIGEKKGIQIQQQKKQQKNPDKNHCPMVDALVY